jgi:hypothetical protein
MVAACSRPDLLSLTSVERPGGAGPQPISGPGQVGSQTPLPSSKPEVGKGDGQEIVLPILWDVLRQYQFQREPLFAGLRPVDAEAEALVHASRSGGRVLEACDQAWLNRHLLEAAFRQATGHPCFRRLNSALDGILVSDVGKQFEVQGNHRAGGLIRTALRATDIVMDRVWQLEIETFQDSPGFVFAPITEVVEPAEDPTALHREIQRQAVNIRTDFDRFSPLEISSLVRHGYCVGRKVCRAHPELFGAELPLGAPWDPSAGPRATAPPAAVALPGRGPLAEPVAATVEARALQDSALRRIWSTLLDRRDWTSYVYVPLLVPILILVPYLVVKFHERSQRNNHLVESLSQGSRDLEKMSQLFEGRQEPWIGEPAEEVPSFDEQDLPGFEILQDSRIFDLRSWKPAKDTKFINCRIGLFWHAVWLVIWAIRKRIVGPYQEPVMSSEYPQPVEEAMRYTFSTLNERQRRLFAATEALKLGHGGIAYIAQLLDCHRRTIERGLNELRHPDSLLPVHRARKKGAVANGV